MNADTARSFRFFMRRDTGKGTNLSRSGKHDPESMSFIHWFKDDESTWPGEAFPDAGGARLFSPTPSAK